MGAASYIQSSFLGGEWSKLYQGRMDSPRYAAAMNRCLNAVTVEEGSNTRRPGTRFVATTRNGDPGRVMRFNFTQSSPYNFELTAGHLRLFAGTDLVKEGTVGVSSISADDPAVVSVDAPVNWVDGDQVEFEFESASSTSSSAILRFRQFVVNMLSTTTFTLADPITGELVDGAEVDWDPVETTAQVSRIVDFVTPYTGETWRDVRMVQDERIILLLHPTIQPHVLEAITSPSDAAFAEFNFATANFLDGPYLDPMKGATLNPDAVAGDITLLATFQAWEATAVYGLDEYVNSGGTIYKSLVGYNFNNTPSLTSNYWQFTDARFVETDVGRLIRLFSQPEPWDVLVEYEPGDKVTFDGAYYVAIEPPEPDPDNPPDPNTGKQPDVELEYWAIDVRAAIWTWGEITEIVESNAILVQLLGDDLLYEEDILTWRLGVYSDTTGYPTNGCYHEGRFWLAGAQGNRIDASKSNDPFNFSPTSEDGTVADNNAIAAIFNADTINTIVWCKSNMLGVQVGTQEAEWLIQASSLSDPLTPTSIQAHKVSTFGSESVEPITAGLATVFVQRYGRKVMELLPAEQSNARVSGNNLSLESKHLTTGNVEELAYQEELFPCVWARTGEGKLIGVTYRRASVQAITAAWHRHELGTEREVVSIAAGPSVGGDTDSLFMVTFDPTEEEPVYWVEILTNLFDQDDTLLQAWFLDGAITPSGATVNYEGDVPVSVTFYGLWYLNGQSVTIFAAGLDLGEFTIENGQVTVPFTDEFTYAYLQAVSSSGEDFGGLAVFVDSVVTVTPPEDLSQTILSYIPPSPLGLPSNRYADWDNDRFVIVTAGSIYTFDLFTGRFIASNDVLPMFNPPISPDPSFYAGVLASDGFLYNALGSGNINPVGRIDLSNVEEAGVFGILSTGFTTWPYGVPGITTFGAARAGGHTFIAVGGWAGDTVLAVFDVDDAGGMSYCTTPKTYGLASLQFITLSEGGAQAVMLAIETTNSSTQSASFDVHVITIDGNEAFDPWADIPAYNALTEYNEDDTASVVMTNQARKIGFRWDSATPVTGSQPPGSSWVPIEPDGGIEFSIRGTINASDIDPTWTIFAVSNPLRVILDQTDGNLLFRLTTTDAVVVTDYIVKIRPADLSIVWKMPTPDLFDFNTGSVIRRGYLGSLEGGIGSPKKLWRLNTITQELDSVDVYRVNRDAPQISNDVDGVLIFFGDWIDQPPAPVPIFGTPSGVTSEWMQLYPGSFLIGPVTIDERITIPVVIGYEYTTECQILRPISQASTGAANGPALAKTRRQHQFGVLLHNCVRETISFGTTFDKTEPALFTQPDVDVPYTKLELFSGIYENTLVDDYSFDSMVCWEIHDPFPATVLAISGFISTQDR